MSLKSRFPSRSDVFYVYAACVIPVFLWAILSYLDAFPGFVLRLNVWDLIGSASYVLGFALIESLLLLLPWVVLAAIIPARIFKDHFVALASIIVLVSSGWMMYANYHLMNFARMRPDEFLPGFALYLVSLAIPIAAVIRFKRLEQFVETFIHRLSVLAYLYAGLGCIAILVILLRNL